MGRRPLSIDDLNAGTGSFLRSPDQLEIITLGPMKIRRALLTFYYECNIELLVHSDDIRCLNPDDILGRGLKKGHEQKSRYVKQSLHIPLFYQFFSF